MAMDGLVLCGWRVSGSTLSPSKPNTVAMNMVTVGAIGDVLG
jgi:hypothetical protein